MADSAGPPIKFPIAPARAMEMCLENLNLTVGDLDRVEVNEAFAVVALACQKVNYSVKSGKFFRRVLYYAFILQYDFSIYNQLLISRRTFKYVLYI